MDEAFPLFFHQIEERLNLRDGYVTVCLPVDGDGEPVTNWAVQGVVRVRHELKAPSSCLRQDLTRTPTQLHDGTWRVERFLVPIEASPYAPTRAVDRALWAAASDGYVRLVEAALKEGALVDARMPHTGGFTALHVAAANGHVAVVKCLGAHGANVSGASQEGYTPLHTAAASGQVAVAEALVLTLGAPIHAVNWEYDTPLHRAAANGHLEMSQRLVELGGSVYRRNGELRTPSDVAARMSACYDYLPQEVCPPPPNEVAEWRERLQRIAALLSPAEDGAGAEAWGVFAPRNVNCTVFVASVDAQVPAEELSDMFAQCGGIHECLLAPPRAPHEDSQHAGYGWVAFDSQESVARALQMDNALLGTRRIKVRKFVPKQTTDSAPGLP